MLWAIDPGTTKSAFVRLIENGELNPQTGDFGIMENDDFLAYFREELASYDTVVIEMVESFGMPVGKEIFQTVLWIGRFTEAALSRGASVEQVFRKEEKLTLCNSPRAKDPNIRQALIDRFGQVGTKKNPGWFYGFKADIWAAYAVAVTYAERSGLCEINRAADG